MRIQEFSSGGGGFKLSENFDKLKKRWRKENRGLWCSFDFPDDYILVHTSLFSVGHGILYNYKPSLQKRTDDMVVLIM